MEQNNFPIYISIIVPIYNTNCSLLKSCIESIRKVKIPLEILLINDGSDKWVEVLCEKYAALDHRVHYFYQKNQGVSVARNLGIEEAKGKFLCFVDADDLVESQVINELDTNLLQFYDLVIFNSKESSNEETVQVRKSFTGGSRVLSIEILLNTLLFTTKINECWAKLYSRQKIMENNIRFSNNIKMGEDFIFNCTYLHTASSCYYYNKTIYHYFRNKESCTEVKSVDRSRFNDLMLQYSAAYDLVDYMYIDSEKKIAQSMLNTIYINFLGALVLSSYSCKLSKMNIKRIVESKCSCLIQSALGSTKIGYYKACVYKFLFCNNLYLAFKFLAIIKKFKFKNAAI